MAEVINCLRCNTQMVFAGTKNFHEGSYWAEALLGAWGENREVFDIYYCPRCGKAEFFVDGIGEELRPGGK